MIVLCVRSILRSSYVREGAFVLRSLRYRHDRVFTVKFTAFSYLGPVLWIGQMRGLRSPSSDILVHSVTCALYEFDAGSIT